jgi:hypothetical protein
MEVKLFEVRDVGTTMVVIGLRLGAQSQKESRMLSRCGFEKPSDYVLCGDLDGGKFAMTYDKYDFCQDSRTKFVAFGYIQDHWDRLETGAVVDVEFVLNERSEPKAGEI